MFGVPLLSWLYPLHEKSDIASVFIRFKSIIENFFKTSIVTVYSNGGGEYVILKYFFDTHGIQHLKIPFHTSEHNSSPERRHKYVVQTELTLLYSASLPFFFFWPYAFQMATYLINRLPTQILSYKSPFECLFHIKPNYNKLCTLGAYVFLSLNFTIKIY